MNILRALQREEKKSLKLIDEAQEKLNGVREAMRVLGGKIGKATGRKRRKMSAATRKKMAASAKKRWAAAKETK